MKISDKIVLYDKKQVGQNLEYEVFVSIITFNDLGVLRFHKFCPVLMNDNVIFMHNSEIIVHKFKHT